MYLSVFVYARQHRATMADNKCYSLRVQNVVVTMKAGIRINLQHAAEVNKGRLARRVFPASIHRMFLPTCTVSVFENGGHLTVGTCHTSDALLAAHLIMYRYAAKMGIYPRFHNFRVCNVVCSVSIGPYLNIVDFWRKNRTRTVYTPDNFEGAHFYPRRNPWNHKRTTVFVMFTSGKLVITGGKSREEIEQYFKDMLPVLRTYQQDEPVQTPSYGCGTSREELARNKSMRASLRKSRTLFNSGPGGALASPANDPLDDEEKVAQMASEYMTDEDHQDDYLALPVPNYDPAHRERSTKFSGRGGTSGAVSVLGKLRRRMRGMHREGQARSKRFKPVLRGI